MKFSQDNKVDNLYFNNEYPINELRRDRKVFSKLKERGILIAGLDVVGDFLTEINITCPTCFRELLDQKGINLMEEVFDFVES